ncbi:hypothetical protein CRE_07857 [Caenorhabditis remanei]|uniref:SAND domain-containing protein n=1 Tax=Caenorhabditis remanei TaxID=31234 RepID=E3NII2_CAERE|nr:hypothetical protein CRE_07857 [Caenorhabditis remanei]
MKRVHSIGLVSPEPSYSTPPIKLSKTDFENENPLLEVKNEEDELIQLGSESIPSPTTSSSSNSAPDANVDVTGELVVEPIAQVIMPKLVEVKCGNLIGVLHTELFICPGIREACIEIPDCLHFLTPVEFTIKAEKSKQKDWKGAIKHNGKMLRTLMEFKQLDFYNHHTTCSFKCHSRNYITKGGTPLPRATHRPAKEPKEPRRHSSAPHTKEQQTAVMTQLLQGELMKNPTILAAFAAHCNAENQKRKEEAERKLAEKQTAIREMMENDPTQFWTQTMHSKMSTFVLTKISREFGILAQNLCRGVDFETSASKMAQVIQILGISDSMSREMCGEFVMPSSTATGPVFDPALRKENTNIAAQPSSSQVPEEIRPILPIQNPPMFNLNNNNITSLSSSEKLELMLKQII